MNYVRLLTPLLLIAGLLAGCQSLSHPDHYPAWFRTLQRPALVLGYGVGRNREEANTQAQWEISQTISTDINGVLTLQIETQPQDAKRKSSQQTTMRFQHELTGLKTLRYETDSGWHYVALGYQNSGFIATLEQSVALKQSGTPLNCTGLTDLGYLDHTALALRIEDALGCLPAFSLERQHGRWYGVIESQSYPLAEGDFAGLFTNYQHQALSLHASTDLLTETSLYSLSVNTREAGELSMIQLSADGSSMVLFSRKPVRSGARLVYPPASQFAGLQPLKMTPLAQEKLLTLAVLCPPGLDFEWLPDINEQAAVNSNPEHLPGLLSQLEHCKASALVQTITPT